MNEEELKFHNEFKDWTKEEILSRAFEIATKNIELTKERDKLQNNWNELKKYISEQLQYYSLCEDDYKEFNILDSIESRMQELQGDDKN